VSLPRGRVALVQHPPSVCVLAVDGDRVLCVRQGRPGAPGTTLELPAGGLEAGESPREAAQRELREECSTAAAQWRELGAFWLVPAYSTERVHVFEARGLRADRGTPDHDEDIVVERHPAADLHALLDDGASLAALALWRAATPA
jgi:ADP-ribose pyrophosphatase